MIEIMVLIPVTLFGIALILIAKYGKLDGFPSGILVMLYGVFVSVLLGFDSIPLYIGIVGFAILGSLGIVQIHRRLSVREKGIVL